MLLSVFEMPWESIQMFLSGEVAITQYSDTNNNSLIIIIMIIIFHNY